MAAALSFGELLRQHRLAAGLTQEALAERAGLSVHGLQKLERGVTRPRRESVQRLLAALQLPVGDQAELRTAAGVVPRSRRALAAVDTPRHNLPVPVTSFIGREHDVGDVGTRLAAGRLLTLTGVGGCGKTRLALQVAWAALDRYPDGVWVVDLAPLADAALVPQTVASVFNLRETPDQPLASALATALRGRKLLLVLDDCEHLLDGCVQLVALLLRACPELRVLATSREALGITGEIIFRVPSLPTPDPQRLPPLSELAQNPAVRLFVERAAAVQPQFLLTKRNAPAVAEICERLDGIPLALELAAARIEALSADQLAARLDQRFRLLTDGSRAALPRHQTLRATLDWSYELLSEPERRLFNRLAVFAGGWTLEAAEAVCAGEGIEPQDVLEVLIRLIRKSLVIADQGGDGAARYRLLETLRQYAHERLSTTGETDRIHRQHASYYSALAVEAEPNVWQQAWLERLFIEQDNLRSTMRWFIDSHTVEGAVRLGGRLWPMWVRGGFLTEGRAHLRTLRALPRPSHASSDYAALASAEGLVAFFAGHYAAARASFEEELALRRTLGDQHGLAMALNYLGHAAREQGDYAAAHRWFEQSLALSEALGDGRLSSKTLDGLGTVAHALGDYRQARLRYDQGLALAQQVDNRYEQAWLLHNLGCLAIDQGDYAAARAWLGQTLTLRDGYDNVGFVHMLAAFVALVAAEGLPASALRLAGATASLTQKTGIIVQLSERGRYERWLATARRALTEDVAASAWGDGQDMRLNEAISHALAPHEPLDGALRTATAPRPAQAGDELTSRQREVAALIADGRSNRQISEMLVITERTAAAHVEHILDKLGFASRTQIAVWAVERGLVVSTIA